MSDIEPTTTPRRVHLKRNLMLAGGKLVMAGEYTLTDGCPYTTILQSELDAGSRHVQEIKGTARVAAPEPAAKSENITAIDQKQNKAVVKGGNGTTRRTPK